MKINKSLEDPGLLIKGVNETIKNEEKEQKGEFLGMLLDTLGASLLGNMMAGKGVNRATKEVNRARISILPHTLTNLEIERYYQREPRLNGIYHVIIYPVK